MRHEYDAVVLSVTLNGSSGLSAGTIELQFSAAPEDFDKTPFFSPDQVGKPLHCKVVVGHGEPSAAVDEPSPAHLLSKTEDDTPYGDLPAPVRDAICKLARMSHLLKGGHPGRETWAEIIDVACSGMLEETKRLADTVAALERLRPHWAKGYTSDSIAAQSNIAALSELWKLLDVDNQTAAVMKLTELVNKAAAPKTASPGGERQRRVVCAANKLTNGRIVLGLRHMDNFMWGNITVLEKAEHNQEQGFVDQYGVWMDRKEAWDVASEAGQIRKRVGADGNGQRGHGLFSENLY